MSDSKHIPNTFQNPNAYVDEYMAFLTANEYKVLSYAIRRILGFNKISDCISISQFSTGIVKNGEHLDYGTGLGETAVRTALQGLVKFKLMVIVKPADFAKNEAPEYTLQWDSTKVDHLGLTNRWGTKKQKDQEKTEKMRATTPRSDTHTGSDAHTGAGLTHTPGPGLTDETHINPVETQRNPIAPKGARRTPEKKGDIVDGILHFGGRQNGKGDFAFLQEHLRPLAQAFLEMAGEKYKPIKADYSLWRKVLSEWYERGFIPEQVKAGTTAHVEKKLSIKSPASVTYAIIEAESKVYTYLEVAT